MNISKFVAFINETKGLNIDGSYYAHIDTWRQWWEGFVPSFHQYQARDMDGIKRTKTRESLRMAKKACEDWRSLLINDKTTLNIDDAKTSKWLLGENQTGGILNDLRFWTQANGLAENAFWSGTGAFVLSIENMQTQRGEIIPSQEAELHIDYLDAGCIIPLTIKHGKVIDCAFATNMMIDGKKYIFLQAHILGQDGYKITNEMYSCDDETVEKPAYKQESLPTGMVKNFNTGTKVPFFAIFSPAIQKNIRGGDGLGMAIFAEAIDTLTFCDKAFNNYNKDIYLGAKKIFYSRRLVASYIDSNGNEVRVTPDEVQQQLFYQSETDSLDEKTFIYEYNPDLRVEANEKAVQDALDYFSFKVGLGTHHYQFEHQNITTATQYTGERQDMVQNANKHQTQIESALLDICKAIIYAGKNIQGADIDPEAEITVSWDDSYIMDESQRREIDRQDVINGFIPRWKYNMIWRGMSEDEARAMVAEAQKNTSDDLGFEDEEE